MSFLEWLKSPQRFLRYDDAFALTRERLHQAIVESIGVQLAPDRTIMLVSHFGDTFSAVQAILERHDIGYEMVPRGIRPREFADACVASEPTVPQIWIALSASLVLEPSVQQVRRRSPQLAAMIMEHHPHPGADANLESWFRQTGLPVQLGWFVALSDSVVQRFVHRNLLDLMQQLGMGQNDLVSSHMLSRRLTTVLRRNECWPLDTPFADSCDDWLANLNRNG